MNPSSLRIAIIIRTKNRPQMLTRCLNSLRAQLRPPTEIILVNDGGISLDNILFEFNDLPIIYLQNPHSQGRARAGNQGVIASTADFIGFLDDDDIYLPDHLQRLEQALTTFDARIAYTGCRLVQRDVLNDNTDAPLRNLSVGEFNEGFEAARLRYENYIPLINILIKRDLWLEERGFDENFDLFEDWDILIRLAQRAHFYHVAKITTEYNLWGNEQVTREATQQRWLSAYRQILAKHIIPLTDKEKLEILADYWRISQERRGILRDIREEHIDLKQQLWQQQQTAYDKEQALIQTHHQEKLVYEQKKEEYERRLTELQNALEHERRQNYQLTDHFNEHSKKLEKELQKAREFLERYQADAEEFQQEAVTLREILENERQGVEEMTERFLRQRHELSKQLAIGMHKNAFDKILLAPTDAYVLANSASDLFTDFHRLTVWIRDKAQQLESIEQEVKQQSQLQLSQLQQQFSGLQRQLQDLAALMSRSRWWHVRRYIPQLQGVIAGLVTLQEGLPSQLECAVNLREKLGLSQLHRDVNQVVFPPPRPLSSVYPVFVAIAGDSAKPQFMESVAELGEIPFLLEENQVLVFSTQATAHDFWRVDVRIGTRLRVNTCHIRAIVREYGCEAVLRVAFVDAFVLVDNSFMSLVFEPIVDSAGKVFQIEIDSPDATAQDSIAIWCHAKLPRVQHPLQIVDNLHFYHNPQILPVWVQNTLEIVPLAASVNAALPSHLLWVTGITAQTSILSVYVFLYRFSVMLEKANTTAQVVLVGELSAALQGYCLEKGISYQLVKVNYHINTDECIAEMLLRFLQWGKAETTAEFAWYCHLLALPTPEMGLHLQDMVRTHPLADVFVPQERQSDGVMRAGYASMLREGVLYSVTGGTPAHHPYHGYRRVVSAVDTVLLIYKVSALVEWDIEALTVYESPLYQVTDMIWQSRERGRQAVYQSALLYDSEVPRLEVFGDKDCAYFRERWQGQLPIQSSLVSRYLSAGFASTGSVGAVLVIDATLPTFDEDSGSLRLLTLLRLWVEMGYHIAFLPDNLDGNPKYRYALERLGVEVFHSGYGIADALAYRQYDFAFICRVEIGHRYMPFVHLMSPQTRIFYDTVDIHFIRQLRQAEIEDNPRLAALALETKRQELYNCRMADRVITVTEQDGLHLQRELPHLAFSVIPNIHVQPPRPSTTFAEREGLVFIGNYNHEPNQDAVHFFVAEVLPLVHAQLPEVKLYVVGSNMKPSLAALASEFVEIVGWVDEVEPVFSQRRVFVSYLRYGAGMKGKLGQAMSLGLPIVSTTVGAEGMGLVHEKNVLIGDDPASFAAQVCRLYTDAELWEQLATTARADVEEQYGEVAVQRRLAALLADFK